MGGIKAKESRNRWADPLGHSAGLKPVKGKREGRKIGQEAAVCGGRRDYKHLSVTRAWCLAWGIAGERTG